MQVVNKTRKIVLSKNASPANTLLGRMRGLMFSGKKDLILDCGFDDIPSSAIHMMFMKFPIDVIWVDSSMTVVDLIKGVEPFNPLKPKTWRIYKPEKPARYVIELGIGNRSCLLHESPLGGKLRIENRKLGTTQIGDEIEFKQND